MKLFYCVGVCLLLCVYFVDGKYNLVANFSGDSFFDNFNFENAADPTHGFVDYQTADNAKKLGLIKTNGNGPVFIGSDHTTVPTGRGRASVRLSSKKTFNNGLFIMDLTHMPTGCGTWPAWWTVGPNWPNAGEIDIIEGVNTQTVDQTTLHTSAGCDMGSEDHSKFTGTMGNANCQGNQGCGITGAGNSYGAPFNSHQGGVFAMEWTGTYIQTFYWPRSSIPADVTSASPNVAGWGKPYAWFQLGSNCAANHFNNHAVVLDLTFCGDWAGAVFASQCPGKGDCAAYVKNNPAAFSEAYWDINYIHVYLNQ